MVQSSDKQEGFIMKYLALLLLMPSMVFGASGDTLIRYHNISNVALDRILSDQNDDRIYYFSNTTNRPELLDIGTNLSITGGVLNASLPAPEPTDTYWDNVLDKPVWTGVFNGSYNSLTDKPTIPTQVTSLDWTQITGKPTLFQPSYHTHSSFDVSDMTAVGRDFLTAGSWAWVRSILSDDLWAWMDNFDGSYESLAGKPVIPDSLSQMTNDAGYVVTADPRLKVSYSTRVQTDSNGDYTFTFPAAFGSTPKISLAVESSSTDYYTAQITSVSTTAVSVKVRRTSAVTVLSVSVLGVQSPAQTYVHITATE